ncbi:MAG: ABC transporter permease [Candidatus Binatia bacterium]
MILRALLAAFHKDLRLLLRDPVGLVFLTLAPMIVITVAGFSLASLYGAAPRGEESYRLPVVDEDGGPVGRAVRDRLRHEPAVAAEFVASRREAIEMLERREAGVALVIPADASGALAEGTRSTLLLLTDPVKYLEVANVRVLVEELRHALEEEGRRQAALKVAAARETGEAARREFTRVVEQARHETEALRARLEGARAQFEERKRTARERAEGSLRVLAAEHRRQVAERLARELAPVRSFLATLADRRQAFEDWFAALRKVAGQRAGDIPEPPAPPLVPAELTELASADPEVLVVRLLGPVEGQALPELADFDLPRIALPSPIELPAVPEAPPLGMSGSLDIDEQSATGAPRRLNTFDQNVPGFSVTFLLLGMLLGVSLALLDERDWGTLERLRSAPAPLSVLLVAKLGSRIVVGMVQMLLLFAVGRAAFGISLGPEPWSLALPTLGIVFAGTTFGLVVAGLARSRESVLPLGSIAIVTMAAVGGCWWPIDLEPPWMRTAALAFPTTWAMTAYNDLMIRRQGFAAALRPTAVLLAHGALYLAIGLWLFVRREGRDG